MNTLQKDLQYKVLNYLSDQDLVAMCSTDTYNRDICNQDRYWLSRLQFKYPRLSYPIINKAIGNRSWNQYYIDIARYVRLFNNPQDMLIHAVRNGDLDKVIVALDLGADITMEAIRYSRLYKHPEVERYLVDKSVYDCQKAMVAAASGDKETLINILGQNPDCYRVALHSALENTPTFMYLMEQGYEVDNQLLTELLVYAAGWGNMEIIQYLLDRGLNQNLDRQSMYEAIRFAMSGAKGEGHEDVALFLLEEWTKVGNNITDLPRGLLTLAALKGYINVIRYLVEGDIDINNAINMYSLPYAARRGDLPMVQFLVVNGAFIRQRTLEMAIENNHLPVVRYLVENGADINILADGELIMYAIEQQYDELADYLNSLL